MTQSQYELFINRIVALEGEAHDMVETFTEESRAQGHWIDIRAKLREVIAECYNKR